MIYLVMAIICAVAFSLMFRISQQKGINVGNAMLFNYVAGALLSGGGAFVKISESNAVCFADALPGLWPSAMACLTGILFIVGFLLMNMSTRNCGVAITTICARSAMAIPMVFSWLLLGDKEPEWLLVALVLVAVAMISVPDGNSSSSSSRAGAVLSLVCLFLIFGTTDSLIKYISHSVSLEEGQVEVRLSLATSLIFVTAFLLSLAKCIADGSLKNSASIRKDALYGILIGLANSGITLMTVRGLRCMPASVFFPIFNVAVVTLCFLAGVFFFRERPGRIQIAGLILALVSIVLFFV